MNLMFAPAPEPHRETSDSLWQHGDSVHDDADNDDETSVFKRQDSEMSDGRGTPSIPITRTNSLDESDSLLSTLLRQKTQLNMQQQPLPAGCTAHHHHEHAELAPMSVSDLLLSWFYTQCLNTKQTLMQAGVLFDQVKMQLAEEGFLSESLDQLLDAEGEISLDPSFHILINEATYMVTGLVISPEGLMIVSSNSLHQVIVLEMGEDSDLSNIAQIIQRILVGAEGVRSFRFQQAFRE